MKFISIKTVFADILTTLDDNILNFADIIEWASHALGQLDVYEFHSQNVAVKKVTNHQAYLPDGTLQVNQIMYKRNHKLTSEEFDEMIKDKTVYEKFEEKYLSKEYCDTCSHQNWSPLKASTNNFMLSVLCDNSPNFTSSCAEEFIILPTGKIVTSFKEGWIIISYLSSPIDEEGYNLMPDDDELIECIRMYVMSRIWEKRWNKKEEGAENRFSFYLNEWKKRKPQVRGKFKLPTEEQQINIINNANSLLPKSKRYFTGFGSFGNPDKTFF